MKLPTAPLPLCLVLGIAVLSMAAVPPRNAPIRRHLRAVVGIPGVTEPVDCTSNVPYLPAAICGPSNYCAWQCNSAGLDWGCLPDNKTCNCRCDHMSLPEACVTGCPLVQPGTVSGTCNRATGDCECVAL